jgi:hypothetical protein
MLTPKVMSRQSKNGGLGVQWKKDREYTASQEKRPCDPLKPLWYKMPRYILLLKEKKSEMVCCDENST